MPARLSTGSHTPAAAEEVSKEQGWYHQSPGPKNEMKISSLRLLLYIIYTILFAQNMFPVYYFNNF